MLKKEFRYMKVYSQSGYHYKPTPTITLKGSWLKELGFESGMSLTVKCKEGQLIIMPREVADYTDGAEKQQVT